VLDATPERLAADAKLAGTPPENFVGLELLRQATWSRLRPTLWHFRDHPGHEVDFVLEAPGGGKIVGIEVKGKAALGADDFRGLDILAEGASEKYHRGIVLYAEPEVLPLGGDHRALYVAWLLNVQYQTLDDTTYEPPTPPGLQSLSAPDEALVSFLRVDPLLISVAAERSAPLLPLESPANAVRNYVGELAPAKRDDLLRRLLLGDEPQLRHKTLRHIQRWKSRGEAKHGATAAPGPRTVGELFAEWHRRAQAERRRAAERAARKRARRAEERARARQEYLNGLASRGTNVWDEAESLIKTRNPANYDRGVGLLQDLRDVASLRNKNAEFEARLQALREHHARKPTLIRRIDETLGR
jgi:hypothetical protein